MLLKVTEDVCLFTPSKTAIETLIQVKNKVDNKIRPIKELKPLTRRVHWQNKQGMFQKTTKTTKASPTTV